ncbi:unnamed protein product [Calicophoron daubneyi]|uniref:Uncharacterized protein n=1 Tax=Calicophoron daubneyi TaxID=300641 RepID=A0AAV2SXD0_CALDB
MMESMMTLRLAGHANFFTVFKDYRGSPLSVTTSCLISQLGWPGDRTLTRYKISLLETHKQVGGLCVSSDRSKLRNEEYRSLEKPISKGYKGVS